MTLDVEWEYAAELCREAYDAGHSVLILGTVGSGKSTVKQMVTEKLPQAATFQVVTWNDWTATEAPPTSTIRYLLLDGPGGPVMSDTFPTLPAEFTAAIRRTVHRSWLPR